MTIPVVPANTKLEVPVTFTRAEGSAGSLDPATVHAYRTRNGVAVGDYLELGTIDYPDGDSVLVPVLVDIPDDEPTGLQIIRTRLDDPTWSAVEVAIMVIARAAPPPAA
jgi:hypothetical protein